MIHFAEKYRILLHRIFQLRLAVARNHTFWAEGRLDYPSSEAVLALHPTFRTMEAWVKEHAPMVRFAEDA